MTTSQKTVVPLHAHEVPPRPATNFPPAFAGCALGRERRPLAQAFGLSGLRVMLTRLAPGARSVLLHAHSREDEFVYVLEGVATLHTEAGPVRLAPGMCVGLPAGTAHDLTNDGAAEVVLLEAGSRDPADEVSYPEADLRAVPTAGGYLFTHKDGLPY